MKTKKSLSEFARILPFYKKGDHQCVKNHRPFSLFPVFNKISERFICKAVSTSFRQQSGFKADNSCNKLIIQ